MCTETSHCLKFFVYFSLWNIAVFEMPLCFFCEMWIFFLTCHYVLWNVALPSQMLCFTSCCAVSNVSFCDTTCSPKCWDLIVFCKLLCSWKCGLSKMLFTEMFSRDVVVLFCSDAVVCAVLCLVKWRVYWNVVCSAVLLLLCFVYWNVVGFFCRNAVVFSFVNSCVLWKVVFWPSGPLRISTVQIT